MTNSLQKVAVISLFVEDVTAAKDFYAHLFETQVLYEDEVSAGIKLENIMINLLQTEEAAGLVAPAQVASADAGNRFQLSLWVEDVDAAYETLSSRGAKFTGEPTNQPWGMRTATFFDPAGNSWEIAAQVEG